MTAKALKPPRGFIANGCRTRSVEPSKSNQAYSFAEEGGADALGRSLGTFPKIKTEDDWDQTDLSIAASMEIRTK